MKEQMEFPGLEPVQPEQPPLTQKVEENSPEFLAMKEAVRQELEKDGEKINEGMLNYMTHMKFVQLGVEADYEARKRKIKESA